MIEAKQSARSRGLASRLALKARRLAQTHAANRVLARSTDPRRWRRAALLWPLFTMQPGKE